MPSVLFAYATLASLLLSLASSAHAAASDSLSPLDFLLGSWTNKTSTAGAGDTFKRDLDRHVLVRLSSSDMRDSTGRVTGMIQGSMTIYPDKKSTDLRAIYFDSVGHVIHYRLADFEPSRHVRFVSDGTDPGPVFRLTYTLSRPKVLHVKFEMAAPERPEVFSVIAEGDEQPAFSPHSSRGICYGFGKGRNRVDGEEH